MAKETNHRRCRLRQNLENQLRRLLVPVGWVDTCATPLTPSEGSQHRGVVQARPEIRVYGRAISRPRRIRKLVRSDRHSDMTGISPSPDREYWLLFIDAARQQNLWQVRQAQCTRR